MYRPEQPIVALCTEGYVARRMKLCWGVVPVVVTEETTIDALFAKAESAAEGALGLRRRATA